VLGIDPWAIAAHADRLLLLIFGDFNFHSTVPAEAFAYDCLFRRIRFATHYLVSCHSRYGQGENASNVCIVIAHHPGKNPEYCTKRKNHKNNDDDVLDHGLTALVIDVHFFESF
jgi:hypothetical protein